MEKNSLKDLVIEKLRTQKEDILKQWSNPEGTHTRHFYVDDLLPEDVVQSIHDAFNQDGQNFYKRKSFRERKSTFAQLSKTTPILSEVTEVFQLQEVIDEISQIVGLTQLEPDPSLYAGGLSMMFPGDFLNPHIDNSHDGLRSRYRRLNLLFYVSPDWKLENGGNFELWDKKVTKPKTIVSKYNRLVVMETNDKSWHSVSPVQIDRARCCVSNYYFSKISPSGSDYFHVTSFTGRPGETGKRVYGVFDNFLRNTVSKVLKVGRGKAQADTTKVSAD